MFAATNPGAAPVTESARDRAGRPVGPAAPLACSGAGGGSRSDTAAWGNGPAANQPDQRDRFAPVEPRGNENGYLKYFSFILLITCYFYLTFGEKN